MSAASALTLLSAAVSVVGVAVFCYLSYRRGRSDGRAQGYEAGYGDGQVDLEEAMADEEESMARLYATLRTTPAGLRRLMREADRNAHSDVLPDLSGRREVVH